MGCCVGVCGCWFCPLYQKFWFIIGCLITTKTQRKSIKLLSTIKYFSENSVVSDNFSGFFTNSGFQEISPHVGALLLADLNYVIN